MAKYESSIQIFENPLLERLTHVHPATPLVIWAPVSGFLIWRSLVVHDLGGGSVLGIGAFALLVWTFTEYVLHRYVFHFEGSKPWQKRLQFLIHGLHHDDPNDPTRLVMPPAAAIVFAVLFFQLFKLIFGPVWVEPFFAFFLIGYLCYDYTHYGVHHFQQRTRFGKYLKKSHMLHHYATPDARWGVSTPLWDYVFGTIESKRITPAAATAHSAKAAKATQSDLAPVREGVSAQRLQARAKTSGVESSASKTISPGL